MRFNSSKMASAKFGSTSLPPYCAGQPAPKIPSRARSASSASVSRVPVRRWSATHSGRTFLATHARAASRCSASWSDTRKSTSEPRRIEESVCERRVFGARIAGEERPGLGTPEVELDVVLERVAVTAVEVQTLRCGLERHLGREQERHAREGAGRRQVHVACPGRFVREEARAVEACEDETSSSIELAVGDRRAAQVRETLTGLASTSIGPFVRDELVVA